MRFEPSCTHWLAFIACIFVSSNVDVFSSYCRMQFLVLLDGQIWIKQWLPETNTGTRWWACALAVHLMFRWDWAKWDTWWCSPLCGSIFPISFSRWGALARFPPLSRIARFEQSSALLPVGLIGLFQIVFLALLWGFLNIIDFTDETSVIWISDLAEISTHLV